ncbi:MAG: hypothetical protein ACRD0I_07780 [Acidimicrobiales bacterium]
MTLVTERVCHRLREEEGEFLPHVAKGLVDEGLKALGDRVAGTASSARH